MKVLKNSTVFFSAIIAMICMFFAGRSFTLDEQFWLIYVLVALFAFARIGEYTPEKSQKTPE